MRLLLPLLIAFGASALEVGVDQPSGWYDPTVSHHSKHAMRGALTGSASWIVIRETTGSPQTAYLGATAISGSLSLGYEVYVARNGSEAIVDPVDVAWEVAGSLVGQSLTHLLHHTITVSATQDTVAMGTAWNF